MLLWICKLLLLTTVTANAAPHGQRWARAAAELDLSEAQKKQVQAVEAEHAATLDKLHEDAGASRKRFLTAMQDLDATTATLTRAHEDMLKARNDLMRARFARMLSMRAVLNKAQLKEFLTKLEEERRKEP